jgi:hypothetical protein
MIAEYLALAGDSAALRRGETLLQSLAGKGGVIRAELDAYYRHAIKKEAKQFSASSLEALLSVMKNSGNFKSSAIETVSAEVANIPAVFLEKMGKKPQTGLAAIIGAFYPDSTNLTVYGAMWDVNVYYTVARHISKSPFGGNAGVSATLAPTTCTGAGSTLTYIFCCTGFAFRT